MYPLLIQKLQSRERCSQSVSSPVSLKISFVTPVTIVHSGAKRCLTAGYLRPSCDLKVDLRDM